MDVQFNAEFNDSDIIKGLERLALRVEVIEKTFEKMGAAQQKAFKEAGDAVNGYEKELDSTITATAKYEKETQNAAAASNQFAEGIRDHIRGMKIFGISVGDTALRLFDKIKALKGTTKALKGTGKGLGLVSKALKFFKIALISTGIGAIVVALGSLIAFLSKTGKGVEFVEKVMSRLGAVVNVLVDHFAHLGGSIIKFFQGDFAGAANEFRSAFTGINEDIRRSIELVDELREATKALVHSELLLSLGRAQSQVKIDKIRNQVTDSNKSYKERIRLLNTAIALEEDLERQALANATKNVEIVTIGTSLPGQDPNSPENLQKIVEAKIIEANIEAQSARRQRRDLQKIDSLKRQSAAATKKQDAKDEAAKKKINDAIEKQLGLLDKQLIASSKATLFSKDAKLSFEYGLAKQKVDELRLSLIELYKEAGIAVPDDFEAKFKSTFDNLELTYRRKLEKLLPSKIDTVIDIKLKQKIQPDFFTVDEFSFTENIKIGLSELIANGEATAEQLGQIFGAGSDLGAAVSDAFFQNIDNQIEENDRLIDSIKKRVSELEKAIDREQKAKDRGHANNLSTYQKQLKEANKAKAKAEADNLKLEKKAANSRLIQNTVEQGSNYVLAISRLVADGAKKGVIGVFTAIAGAALILKLITQAKANASKFAPPKFRFGGSVGDYFSGYVKGNSHAAGGRMIEVEGNEFVMRREAVQGQNGFLKNMNNGRYSNIPLLQIAELMRSSSHSNIHSGIIQMNKNSKEIDEGRRGVELQLMKEAYLEAAMSSSSHVIEYLKTRPVKKITSEGYVLEWMEGNVINRQEVKNKNT